MTPKTATSGEENFEDMTRTDEDAFFEDVAGYDSTSGDSLQTGDLKGDGSRE